MRLRDEFTVTFYGVRGSAPSYMNLGTEYGVNTSCVLVRAGGRSVVLDCGTGAVALGDRLMREEGSVDILQSHVHIDHIQGMPFFGPFFQKGRRIDIYSERRLGMEVKEQLDLFTSPPLWPIKISQFPADICCHTLNEGETFMLGDELKVETRRSSHPDVSTMFRLSCRGRTLVYALDYEHECDEMTLLRDFARGADATIFDATYTEKEYAAGKKGWGHSTWERALRLAKEGECGEIVMSHLSHSRPDTELDAIAQSVFQSGAKCRVAREGLEIKL